MVLMYFNTVYRVNDIDGDRSCPCCPTGVGGREGEGHGRGGQITDGRRRVWTRLDGSYREIWDVYIQWVRKTLNEVIAKNISLE